MFDHSLPGIHSGRSDQRENDNGSSGGNCEKRIEPQTAEWRLSSSGLGGADGNRDRFCRLRWGDDVALAVKNATWLDHKAMRVNLAGGDSLVVNLDFSFCEDGTVEAARDHHVVAFYLPLYSGLLAQN